MEPRIAYRLSIPEPRTHLVDVSMEIEDPSSHLLLRLPVWIPGSYLVREFARQLQLFGAADRRGRSLGWRKTRKDTWEVDAEPGSVVHVSFQVYAHELSVRTSHVDATHAFLNPANLLPYVPGRVDEPLSVELKMPREWTIATALPVAEPGSRYRAVNYHEVVDSPIHAGPDPVHHFNVRGLPHHLATWGRGNLDPTRLIADATRIVEAEAELFGGLPYEQYLFILMLTDGARGGLEHASSCALMLPRFGFRDPKGYERALQLIAHEFFHAWNVKRIRPASLADLDYAAENYTRLLWLMEGTTEYYTSLVVRRAGLITPDRYIEILAEQITQLAETPGRHLQSLEEASLDAWIKYYRPDEHTPNSAISYYLKGALASLLIDLEMRRRTGNAHSLDDLMRLLWARAQRGEHLAEDDLDEALSAVGGGVWTDFLSTLVASREELPFDQPLKAAGIEIEWTADDAGGTTWLGLRTRREGQRTLVSHVLSNSPSWEAGISPGDELLALDGFRVEEGSLNDRLRDYRPGDTVTVAVFRGDQLVEIPVVLASRPATRARLRKASNPNVRQRAIYDGWLGTDTS